MDKEKYTLTNMFELTDFSIFEDQESLFKKIFIELNY